MCGDSEEDPRAMVARFVELCRRGLKVNAGKSKVMALGGEKGLECEICVDGIRLARLGEGVAGAIRSHVNGRGLQLGSSMTGSCLFLCMVVRQ